MSRDGETQEARAKPVGVLMHHYRSTFPSEDGCTGLTMEDVLEPMARINRRYESSAPSTVSRWESGETMPRKKRLQEFGIALNLAPAEIDGLVALAGIEEHNRPHGSNRIEIVLDEIEDVPVATAGASQPAPKGAGTFGESGVQSFVVETVKGGSPSFCCRVWR